MTRRTRNHKGTKDTKGHEEGSPRNLGAPSCSSCLRGEAIWAIVPVKLLSAAKSRLAPVMGEAERISLCLGMLEHVLEELSAARRVDRWAVVSPDARVLELARRKGGVAIQDLASDLNGALRQGVGVARSEGARAVLMLPADLPRLRSQEVDRLVACAREDPGVAIALAEGDGGTNALLLRPPGVMDPAFGPDSFRVHVRRALGLGIPVHIFRSPGLAFDLDTPEALATLELALTVGATPGAGRASWNR